MCENTQKYTVFRGAEMLRDLNPTDTICGFEVRPGYYDTEGAMPVRGGVNFTISSFYATSCTLLLFHPGENTPFAGIPFPDSEEAAVTNFIRRNDKLR